MIGVADFSYLNGGLRNYAEKPVPPYRRELWEIQGILEGECRVEFADHSWLTAPKGSLWIFHPDCSHGWTAPAPDAECQVEVFHVSGLPLILQKWMKERAWFQSEMREGDLVRLKELSERAQATGSMQFGLRQLQVESILMELSYLILQREEESLPSSSTSSVRTVQQTLHWFRTHLHEGCGVEDAALAMHRSPQYLRKLFLKETGARPNEHLTRLRIERAKEYLLQEDYTLEVISEAVGYSCAAALSRAFKAETGKTPGAYQKAHS
ncbi:AraC family transcriptional regulator [Kiritimatiellaeota bacterium B1221]|nr:AraC family transcriptional regulator [Kiritimatiellaeota bacterium B1221]